MELAAVDRFRCSYGWQNRSTVSGDRAAFVGALPRSALPSGGELDSVARALDITGYSATVNDRFSSGFPTAPIANTDASFIGLPYDWSGVGWSATDGTKGFGFISPQHYLVARHYGGASTIRFVSPDGTL